MHLTIIQRDGFDVRSYLAKLDGKPLSLSTLGLLLRPGYIRIKGTTMHTPFITQKQPLRADHHINPPNVTDKET